MVRSLGARTSRGERALVPYFTAGDPSLALTRDLVVEASRPITARKESERVLRNLADSLVTADRHKDEFLAMLAHELRNPLAPLRNIVPLLRSMRRMTWFSVSATLTPFEAASSAMPLGPLNVASLAGPPSPVKPRLPVPATCLSIPDFKSKRSPPFCLFGPWHSKQ